VHQGTQPRQCIEVVSIPGEETEERYPDGRACEGGHSCEQGGKPGADYICERVGAIGTISTAGRVRYRGQLDDPNELSVFLGAALPLITLLGLRRGRATTIFVIGPIIVLSLITIVLSQSRTGQMVIGTIVLIGLLRRYRAKGAVLAAAVIPVIMLAGGREDSEGSALERASILYEGIDLVRAHPFLGVGVTQFHDEISIPLTAHNAYLLAAAELGFVGLVLWAGLLWSAMKIAIVVATNPPPGVDPELVRFAKALVLSFASMSVGIFFLSFSYKQLLFVWLGLAAGLHGAVNAQAPSFRVRTSARDVLGLSIFSVVILMLIFVISRIKAT
jgi:O-antigen ligase